MIPSDTRYDYLNLSQKNMQFICILEELEHYIADGTEGETFLQLIEEFIENGGNPDLTFSGFDIEDRSFKNVTFFQAVYLCWKDPAKKWSKKIDARFERAIDQMLSDARTDVRAKFTETFLAYGEHFFNEGLKEVDPLQREAEGYLLERATIAHYAMVSGDLQMVEKILQKAPDLLQSTCCLVKGKNLFAEEICSVTLFVEGVRKKIGYGHKEFSKAVESIQDLDNDEIAGELATAAGDFTDEPKYSVTRITKVSLLHLAARIGDEMACGYLHGKSANALARDSGHLTPFDYFKLSLSERFISELPTHKRLLKVLEPIERIHRPFLPETSLLLMREGYWIKYDTRTRVASYAYERLTKKSLEKKSKRSAGGTFRVDKEAPVLNRGKSADYNQSGFHKGHLAPAADAVSSDKAMADTFLFTNACPQDPKLNLGYWKTLEIKVRKLTDSYDLVEVFTGGLFQGDGDQVTYRTIGKGETPVPTHFFKVLYLYKGQRKSEEAYIVPNCSISATTPESKFLVTVEKVQALSGILFDQLTQWAGS